MAEPSAQRPVVAQRHRPTPIPRHISSVPPITVPVPASLLRARPDEAPPVTYYDLALRLTATLSAANPETRFGIAVSRRRTIPDLLRTPAPSDTSHVVHLIVDDDEKNHYYLDGTDTIQHLVYDLMADATPSGWDVVEFLFHPKSDPVFAAEMHQLQRMIDLTATSIHLNSFGQRTILWSFNGMNARPPELHLAQYLRYEPIHDILMPIA